MFGEDRLVSDFQAEIAHASLLMVADVLVSPHMWRSLLHPCQVLWQRFNFPCFHHHTLLLTTLLPVNPKPFPVTQVFSKGISWIDFIIIRRIYRTKFITFMALTFCKMVLRVGSPGEGFEHHCVSSHVRWQFSHKITIFSQFTLLIHFGWILS